MADLSDFLARGVVTLADGAKKMRVVQVRLLSDETRDDLEHIEPYGFSSEPHPEAEAFTLFFDGDRSHGVVFTVADRRYRLKPLKTGEVAIFDDLGQKVHLTREGLDVFTPGWLHAVVTKNAEIRVGADCIVDIAGNLTATVGKDATVSVKGNVTSTVGGNESATVKGSLTASVGADASVDVKGSASLTAGGSATLKAASVTIDAPTVTITGDTTIKKSLKVVSSITGTGGMAISGGSGASVSGDMRTTGSVRASGDVTAGGISLSSHTHTERGDGAETSTPH